jgi:hypothetical protein
MNEVPFDRRDWPEILTPELREQFLLEKVARIQQARQARKKLPRNIREELNLFCCNEQECEHI